MGPLGDTLLYLSDGIVDVAITIYKRAQVRVIEAGGQEVLTVQELERAAEEDFQQVQAMIRSRRQGIVSRAQGAEITDIDDVRPVLGAPQPVTAVPSDDRESVESEPVTPPLRIPRPRSVRPKPAPGSRGLLPSLGVAAATEGITLYEALRKAGFIKSARPYLDGSVAS